MKKNIKQIQEDEEIIIKDMKIKNPNDINKTMDAIMIRFDVK